MSDTIIVRSNVEEPSYYSKRKDGVNVDALKRLVSPDMCLEVTEKKMNSIRASAGYAGIRIKVRRVPPLTDDPKEEKRFFIFRNFNKKDVGGN